MEATTPSRSEQKLLLPSVSDITTQPSFSTPTHDNHQSHFNGARAPAPSASITPPAVSPSWPTERLALACERCRKQKVRCVPCEDSRICQRCVLSKISSFLSRIITFRRVDHGLPGSPDPSLVLGSNHPRRCCIDVRGVESQRRHRLPTPSLVTSPVQ